MKDEYGRNTLFDMPKERGAGLRGRAAGAGAASEAPAMGAPAATASPSATGAPVAAVAAAADSSPATAAAETSASAAAAATGTTNTTAPAAAALATATASAPDPDNRRTRLALRISAAVLVVLLAAAGAIAFFAQSATAATDKVIVVYDEEYGSLSFIKESSVETVTKNNEQTQKYTIMYYQGGDSGAAEKKQLTVDPDYVYKDVMKTEYTSKEQVPWDGVRSGIRFLYFESGINMNPVSEAYWFMDCKNLKDMIGEGALTTRANTANLKSTAHMWHGCSGYESGAVGYSDFYAPVLEDASYMFYGCSGLEGNDMSTWNVPLLTDVSYFMAGCDELTYADMRNWTAPKLEIASHFMDGCRSLKYVNMDNWNVPFLTNVQDMFANCEALESINLTRISTKHAAQAGATDLGLNTCEHLVQIAVGKNWLQATGGATTTFPPHKTWINASTEEVLTRADEYTDATKSIPNGVGVYRVSYDEFRDEDKPLRLVAVWSETTGSLTFMYVPQEFKKGSTYPSIQATDGVEDTILCTATTVWEEEEFCYPTSFTVDTVPWNSVRGSIESVYIRDGFAPACTAYWFRAEGTSSYTSKLRSLIGWEKLDLTKIVSARSMFYQASLLTYAPKMSLAGFKNNDVIKNIAYMMQYCPISYKVDFEGWESSTLTAAAYAFANSGITSLNLKNAKIAYYQSATNLRAAWRSCTSLTEVNLSGWSTPALTNATRMFWSCTALRTCDMSDWDAPASCAVGGWTSEEAGTNGMASQSMFFGCTAIKYVGSATFCAAKGQGVSIDGLPFSDMSYLFSGDAAYSANRGLLTGLAEVDLSTVESSALTNAIGMFRRCQYLVSVKLSGWNCPKLSYARRMLAFCTRLQKASLSDWSTPALTNARRMFESCTSLRTCDMSGWNAPASCSVSGWTSEDGGSMSDYNSQSMFYGCSRIKYVGTAEFCTEKNEGVILDGAPFSDMSYLFSGLSTYNSDTYALKGLQEVRLTGASNPNLQNATNMFRLCTGLKTADTSGWNTPLLSNASNVFYGCTALKTVDMQGWYTPKLSNTSNAFYNCTALNKIVVGRYWPNLSSNYATFPVGCDVNGNSTKYNWYCDETQMMVTNGLSGIKVWTVQQTNSSSLATDEVPKATYIAGISPQSNEEKKGKVLAAIWFAGDSNLTFDWVESETGAVPTEYNGKRITKLYTAFSYEYEGRQPSPRYTANSNVPWNEIRTSVKTVTFAGDVKPAARLDESNRACVTFWFNGMTALTGFEGIEKLNNTGRQNLSCCFQNCYALTGIDLANFDAASATDLSYCFENCRALTDTDSISLAEWNVPAVTNIEYAFNGCTRLASADLSGWSTPALASCLYLFNGCTSLKTCWMTGWDAPSSCVATEAYRNTNTSEYSRTTSMFSGCTSLKKVGSKADVTRWGEGVDLEEFPLRLVGRALRGTSHRRRVVERMQGPEHDEGRVRVVQVHVAEQRRLRRLEHSESHLHIPYVRRLHDVGPGELQRMGCSGRHELQSHVLGLHVPFVCDAVWLGMPSADQYQLYVHRLHELEVGGELHVRCGHVRVQREGGAADVPRFGHREGGPWPDRRRCMQGAQSSVRLC